MLSIWHRMIYYVKLVWYFFLRSMPCLICYIRLSCLDVLSAFNDVHNAHRIQCALRFPLGQFGASIVALCPKNVGLHSNPAFMLCKPTFEGQLLATSNKPSLSTPTITTTTSTTTITGPQIVACDKAAVVEAKKGDEKIFF